MRVKHSKNRIIYEILLGLLLLSIIVFSILVDFFNFPICELLRIQLTDVESMHMNLFAAQATISVTGAAIVSLLTGVTAKEYYGIPVSKFITRVNPFIFKHNSVIIFTFSITILDYFFVSLKLFDLSIAVFLCSIISLIYLVRDTFVVFLGEDELKKRIANTIADNNLDTFSSSLFSQSIRFAQLGWLSELKDNLSLVEKILMKEEINDNKTLGSQNIEKIEDFLIDLFKIIVHRKQPDENGYFLNYILKMYKESNTNKVCFNLWWKSPNLFFQSISYLTYDDYREEYIFLSLFEALIQNEKFDSNLKQDSANVFNNSLIFYSGSIYKSLFVNEEHSLLKNKKNKIIYDLYEDIFRINFYSRSKNTIETNYEWLLMELDLCYLFKCFIDNGESGKVWNKLFSRFQPLNNHQTIDLSILCIVNYLYYLAKYEPLAKDTPAQKKSVEILTTYNSSILSQFYNCKLVEIIQSYKEIIFRLMRQWEWYPEETAKMVISEYSTIDYLIFLALNTCWDNTDVSSVIESLSDGSMFSLYNRYFNNNSDFDEIYSNFQQLFFDGRDNTIEVKERLLSIVCDKYKQEIIDEGKEREIKDNNVKEYREILLGYCQEAKSDLSEYFCKTNTKDDQDNHSLKFLLLKLNTLAPLSDDYSNSVIKEKIKKHLLWAYLSILDKEMLHITIDKCDKICQQSMIDIIEIHDLNPNTMMGTKDVFWEEEYRTLLKEYLEQKGIKKESLLNIPNEFFFIDVPLTDIRISGFEVIIRELTPDEIMDSCKKDDDGNLLYNVTNDIYLPFEQNELFEHIQRIRRMIEVNVILINDTGSKKVGVHFRLD